MGEGNGANSERGEKCVLTTRKRGGGPHTTPISRSKRKTFKLTKGADSPQRSQRRNRRTAGDLFRQLTSILRAPPIGRGRSEQSNVP